MSCPSWQGVGRGSGARNLLPPEPLARFLLATLRLRGGVPQVVQEPHFHFPVTAYLVVGWEVFDQLADARAQLVREVRRCGPDEGVDVADRGLGHTARSVTGTSGSEATLQGSRADTGFARVLAPGE